jgi:hypothetical protein
MSKAVLDPQQEAKLRRRKIIISVIVAMPWSPTRQAMSDFCRLMKQRVTGGHRRPPWDGLRRWAAPGI